MSADTTKQMNGVVERLRRAKDGVAPFSLWDEAADEIERLFSSQANTRAALERAKEELTLAADQWLQPSKDGLFKSRVSVLIDQIDAALNPDGEK